MNSQFFSKGGTDVQNDEISINSEHSLAFETISSGVPDRDA
jgi:hypothetical protein